MVLSADDPFADRLRGFGPLGVLSLFVILAGNLVVVPLSAILVLLWARRSRTPWGEIGYMRPESWIRSLAVGIALGVALKLVMKSIVMPLLGADPINQAYQFLVGNPAALPPVLYMVTVGAGFGEETVFRGYLFERLGRLFGTGAWARTAIVLITSGLFGVAHYPEQGLPGVQQAVAVGLVFGTIFAVARPLFMLMFAHAAFDLTAVAIIYGNLESEVAHLFFE